MEPEQTPVAVPTRGPAARPDAFGARRSASSTYGSSGITGPRLPRGLGRHSSSAHGQTLECRPQGLIPMPR